MQIEPEVNVLEHCLDTYSVVHNNFIRSISVLGSALADGGSTIYTDKNGYELDITWVDAWIDLTKVLYDASHWFKDCYSR